jgi:hypothetical protein
LEDIEPSGISKFSQIFQKNLSNPPPAPKEEVYRKDTESFQETRSNMKSRSGDSGEINSHKEPG